MEIIYEIEEYWDTGAFVQLLGFMSLIPTAIAQQPLQSWRRTLLERLVTVARIAHDYKEAATHIKLVYHQRRWQADAGSLGCSTPEEEDRDLNEKDLDETFSRLSTGTVMQKAMQHMQDLLHDSCLLDDVTLYLPASIRGQDVWRDVRDWDEDVILGITEIAICLPHCDQVSRKLHAAIELREAREGGRQSGHHSLTVENVETVVDWCRQWRLDERNYPGFERDFIGDRNGPHLSRTDMIRVDRDRTQIVPKSKARLTAMDSNKRFRQEEDRSDSDEEAHDIGDKATRPAKRVRSAEDDRKRPTRNENLAIDNLPLTSAYLPLVPIAAEAAHVQTGMSIYPLPHLRAAPTHPTPAQQLELLGIHIADADLQVRQSKQAGREL